MRLLYARNGVAQKPLTVADIQAAVEETGGRSYAGFFQKFIAERNELPLPATLAKLGWSCAANRTPRTCS